MAAPRYLPGTRDFPIFERWEGVLPYWDLPGNKGEETFMLEWEGQNSAPWPGYIRRPEDFHDCDWQPPVWDGSLRALCLMQQGLFQYRIGEYLRGDLRGPFRLQLLFKVTAMNHYLRANRIMTLLEMWRYYHWRMAQCYHWSLEELHLLHEVARMNFFRRPIRYSEMMGRRWCWYVPPHIPRCDMQMYPSGIIEHVDTRRMLPWVKYYPRWGEHGNSVLPMYDPTGHFIKEGGQSWWEDLMIQLDQRDLREMQAIPRRQWPHCWWDNYISG